MQRYQATSINSGSNNNAISGVPTRENARSESPFSTSNFSLNPRRQLQLAPYKLKCDKELLNSRLGPPDFYPQTPNCPEETLTREYLQSGYKETVEGIEEAREIVLSQLGLFIKPEVVLKCKEAIRKRFRAINESRAQKRKAGQVYGVPLSGSLLAKPGVFPEQRPCGEDFRRKWIEALSQQHKPLRSLSDHVPHGYRRKSLFDILTRHNVPLSRATWFIKVTYLNQVRPASTSVSSGVTDKSQISRTEQWTKDVIEYLHQLLEELSLPKAASVAPASSRDPLSPNFISGHALAKHKTESSLTGLEAEELSFQFKWRYMIHLLQWHFAEGLLLPSLVVEWVLNQLQEKDSAEALELLLPIVLGVIDSIVLSQTYIRVLVEVTIRHLSDGLLGSSNSSDSSKKTWIASILVEVLQYMILAVPDAFVSLDCFPLPSSVAPGIHRGGTLLTKKEDTYFTYQSLGNAVSSIEKRASDLGKTANPCLQGCVAAKVVQTLDRALVTGNVTLAYSPLFEDLSDNAMEQRWITEVSSYLQSSLRWIGTVELSLICSVFFLCEWATCDYRNYRSTTPRNIKLTGRKDFSQVYVAVLLLKTKMEVMQNLFNAWNTSRVVSCNDGKNTLNDPSLGATLLETAAYIRNNVKSVLGRKNKKEIFESPGPLHDIIVCWLDQHEVSNSEGSKRVEALIIELIHSGIFYPQAYVRQLIVSGVMDRNCTLSDLERKERHHRILKQLPGSCLFEILEEARIAEPQLLNESVAIYSSERQLVLRGHVGARKTSKYSLNSLKKQNDRQAAVNGRTEEKVAEVKALVSTFLCFPYPRSVLMEALSDGKTFKRPTGWSDLKVDLTDIKSGCEECKSAKRQKIDERSSFFLGIQSNQSDDEDTWWAWKGLKLQGKLQDSIKVLEPPHKPTKQSSRGRQKGARKTQSLAQLPDARIESSNGASSSHVCDSKSSCPHHKSVAESEIPKDYDRTKMISLADIGKSLTRLRLLERRSISIWLLKSIRELVEGSEIAGSKASNITNIISASSDDRIVVRWRLGEDELLSVLYILDICNDFVSAVRFLLWLLKKIRAGMGTSGQVGRTMMQQKNRENNICQVGEAFLLSSLQRYENVVIVSDLLPEVLTAVMHKNLGVAMPSGRYAGSVALAYIKHMLKKYKDVASVVRWEKNLRATCDQRLLIELDNSRSIDVDLACSSREDMDDHIRQKLSGRMSRSIPNMKEIVQLQVEEAFRHFYGKERKCFAISTQPKGSDKWEDGYQIAHDIVLSLLEGVRQNGGANPDGDPSIVASAVSAIVGNVGLAVAKLPDLMCGTHWSLPSAAHSLNCARHILNVHIISLCLLKEALGDRFSRVFEVTLAMEASTAVSVAFAPGKVHRSHFQPSPETHDVYGNQSNDFLNNSAKGPIGRAVKVVSAVSALVVGSVVHGVISLERMIAAFRLKEGLDITQFIRTARSSSNGVSRSVGSFKLDGCVEVYVHWFRLLVGNCRTVSDGLVAEILGESYLLALSRMQRLLPLSSVFPLAYSIFGVVIWRPYILHSNIATHEDIQLYQHLSIAIADAIIHQPFRNLCFQDTNTFYDLLATDGGDSEFAAMLELHIPDKHLKMMAFVPLRARLFLNALTDCKMPSFIIMQEDGSWVTEPRETSAIAENEAKHLERLLQVLDTLQPAKFHWQWVELRLLLNEQALIEKIETQNMSFVEAVRSLSPNAENFALSESEKRFTEIILSRVLVRPDAAPLYSEVIHLLGKLLQESLVVDIKWILAGSDVLLGRKSIRQQLVYVAQRKGLPTKPRFWKPWGWSSMAGDAVCNKGVKRKLEVPSLEEGEVVDECFDLKRSGRTNFQNTDYEGLDSTNQHVTEKAFTELMLPCIDRSSNELRNLFASELIKQIGAIEQHINTLARSGSGIKQTGAISSAIEGASNKASGRKGMRGGSPVIGRRLPGVNDLTPPSASALRASLWLRLQFLTRLLPVIYADRNMRQMFASIILRLLGARAVYDDAGPTLPPINSIHLKRDMECSPEASADTLFDGHNERLFDRLLCVLYALLSSCKPSWLKPKSNSKSTVKSLRDFPVFDRDAAEGMQSELDRMDLPPTIRRRIQAAIPFLPLSRPLSIPGQAPLPLLPAFLSLQGSAPVPNPQQRNVLATWASTNLSGRGRALPSPDLDVEVDPWTLLEDGTASTSTSNSSTNMSGVNTDHSNFKACSWLKGAIRVRRTDLTYVGSLDDDS